MGIDKKSVIPLYYQLADHLREKIKLKMFQPGDMLPSESELMQQFDISRGTVRQALQALFLEGLIERYPGKGSFVSRAKVEQDASREMGFFSQFMREAGKKTSAKVLDIKEYTAPENVRKKLELDNGSEIVAINRLRFVDDEPWAIELQFFRYDVGQKLINQDLTGSIYKLLQENLGYVISKSKNTIEAVPAHNDIAKLLAILEGTPLFELTRIVYLNDGNPFEYSIDLYRADRIRFTIEDDYLKEKPKFRIRTGKGLLIDQDVLNSVPTSDYL